MKNILIVILAGKETHEGLGRLANALVMARELKESGNNVKMIFDGAGAEWVPEVSKESHEMHSMYKELKPSIVGVCDFCAGAFHVKDKIKNENMLAEFQGHPSFKKYVEEGYQIINF